MEELVILIIFALIIFFNFIIKKIAGQGRTAEENGEAAGPSQPGGEYTAPQREIRDFLDEIKKQAARAKSAQRQSQQERRPTGMTPREQEAAKRAIEARDQKEKARRHRTAAVAGQQRKKEKEASAIKAAAPAEKQAPQPAEPAAIKRLTALRRPELQKAVVMSEVLGKPIGLRDSSV